MLIIATLIICVAHVIRVFRWELLIETYERPNGVRLTKSLALGYFLNYFLPFKVGDIGRAIYAGRRMQNGRGFALATVIVERCLDVIAVGAMFVVFAMTGVGDGDRLSSGGIIGTNSGYYIILGVGVLIGLFTVYVAKKYIKRFIYIACGLLNEKYEEKILRFFWALIWGFKDIISRLPKLKLFTYTVLMWGLYLSSYGAFSVFFEGCGVNRSFSDVFFSLFDQTSLFSSGITNGFVFGAENGWYVLFLVTPSIILYIMATVWDRLIVAKTKTEEHVNLIPQVNTDERRTFLKMYFAGEKKEYIENYLQINRNILVLRDYSAGSNATTILCTDGEQSFYRKYAFQGAADKLEEQIEWLSMHERIIPVAEIIRKDVGNGVCFYDMPYYSNAVTLFEYIQSGEKERAWNIIENAFNILECNLYNVTEKNNNKKTHNREELLNKYIDDKVIKNINRILNDKSLSELLKYETIVVNGKEYSNLKKYVDSLETDNLISIFRNDEITEIHGDLTIENIICKRDDFDFYFIDPNAGNIFDTKFIDYAKMLQSIHGRYEFLMAVDTVNVDGNHVNYKFIESDVYSYLYSRYKEYLGKKFNNEEIKSIYYHEIINWLRLMPYKLEKGKGVLFYTGLLRILEDIMNSN